MKKFLINAFRIFVSWNAAVISAIILFFAAGHHFWWSALGGVGFYLLTSFLIKRRTNRTTAAGVMKEEKAYVKQQIKEARRKINKIGMSRFKVRSITALQTISKIHTLSKKVLAMVENDASRYRSAQNFFNSYLDSTVTIVEKYTHLASQPVKSKEMYIKIRETEELMTKLSSKMENDLLGILSEDVMTLDVELKLLEQTMEETTAAKDYRTLELPKKEKEYLQ